MPQTARIPIFQYEIVLVDHPADQPPITVHAMADREDGPWTIWDDTRGTVLRRRTDTVLEVRRSIEPVAHQETDQL